MSNPETTDHNEDWALSWARSLVAKWEHGDEAHRRWLREIAIPELAAALRDAKEQANGQT